MNFASVQWKDLTYQQDSCSKAFSSFYTLALLSFYGLALPCCRAMGVETVHEHDFLNISPLPVGPNLNLAVRWSNLS